MKKLFFAAMLFPLLAIGQQEKNIVSSHRVFPKTDKIVEFEKALANHHQKFHTNEWKVNVFFVETGPDAGAYQVTMGPFSWEEIDKRKTTPEHDLDWNRNVMTLVHKLGSSSYLSYNKELSTVAVGDFVEKVTINHLFYKVGEAAKLENLIGQVKKVWEMEKQSVAVYRPNSSGEGGFALVTRHQNGWADKGVKPSQSFREAIGGNNAFDEFMSDLKVCLERSYSEMISMRKDLSSK